jgi:L-iditol 2-dehydrogenase
MARGLYRLPSEVSDDRAVFIEPLACVARGQRLVGLPSGGTVLVVGSGITGLLHIRLARVLGAGRVIATDVVDYRKRAAIRSGADVVIDGREDVPKQVQSANRGRFADLVITCTGAPAAIAQGLNAVDRGGKVLFFAPTDPSAKIDLPFNALWREEVTMTSSYGGAPQDIRAAIELLRLGKLAVDDLITHRLPLEKAGEGFRLVASAQDSIKVILRP